MKIASPYARPLKGTMPNVFEELDYRNTPLGELVLRRRRSPSVADRWVYEVTVNHQMLMSSSVSEAEKALATLALQGRDEQPLEVLVGGLGLGCTAAAALDYPAVRRLDVVELLAPVIDWHRRRLVPLADRLTGDPRCRLIEADFYEYLGSAPAAGPYDVILLDIDHSPDAWLHLRHRRFYTAEGLRDLANTLRPGGVFALWSAWRPDDEFEALLRGAFRSVAFHEVPFYNPHVGEEDSNWVIVAEGPDRHTAG